MKPRFIFWIMLLLVLFSTIMLTGCDNMIYEENLDENKCEDLINKKDNIILEYITYYHSMLQVLTNLDTINQDVFEKSVRELTDKDLSFSDEYSYTIFNIWHWYSPTQSWSLDAPDYCSSKQASRVKKYDDMYIKHYWCFVNKESTDDYRINLLDCSDNLAESYYAEVMNIYHSDKS